MAQAQAQDRWEFRRVSDQWPQAGLEGEVKLPMALIRQFRDCTQSYRLQALPGPFTAASFSSNFRASCSSEKKFQFHRLLLCAERPNHRSEDRTHGGEGDLGQGLSKGPQDVPV